MNMTFSDLPVTLQEMVLLKLEFEDTFGLQRLNKKIAKFLLANEDCNNATLYDLHERQREIEYLSILTRCPSAKVFDVDFLTEESFIWQCLQIGYSEYFKRLAFVLAHCTSIENILNEGYYTKSQHSLTMLVKALPFIDDPMIKKFEIYCHDFKLATFFPYKDKLSQLVKLCPRLEEIKMHLNFEDCSTEGCDDAMIESISEAFARMWSDLSKKIVILRIEDNNIAELFESEREWINFEWTKLESLQLLFSSILGEKQMRLIGQNMQRLKSILLITNCFKDLEGIVNLQSLQDFDWYYLSEENESQRYENKQLWDRFNESKMLKKLAIDIPIQRSDFFQDCFMNRDMQMSLWFHGSHQGMTSSFDHLANIEMRYLNIRHIPFSLTVEKFEHLLTTLKELRHIVFSIPDYERVNSPAYESLFINHSQKRPKKKHIAEIGSYSLKRYPNEEIVKNVTFIWDRD